jgi:starch phosphorylase
MKPGTPFVVEVNPRIPRRLARLTELADNLWYGWDRPSRTLFARCIRGCGMQSTITRRRS